MLTKIVVQYSIFYYIEHKKREKCLKFKRKYCIFILTETFEMHQLFERIRLT